jgi:hypothetical protein
LCSLDDSGHVRARAGDQNDDIFQGNVVLLNTGAGPVA